MKKDRTLVELAGWYGVLAILSAYTLLTFDVLNTKNWIYQVLNLTGAFGIFLDAWTVKNWQPAVLNIVWMLVALIGLISIAR